MAVNGLALHHNKIRGNMDNLPELKDIHIPDGVSAFPPAYGWWILLFAIILLPIIIRFARLAHKKSRRYFASNYIKKIDENHAVAGAIKISELLKRICVYKYPEAVNMFGKRWIEFLNAHAKNDISGQTAELLSNAPYIDKNSDKYDRQNLIELKNFALKWIGENL